MTVAERRQVSIIGSLAVVAILIFDVAAWATGHAAWPQLLVPAMLFPLVLAGWLAGKHPGVARVLIWAAVVLGLVGVVYTGAELVGWIGV